MTRSTYICWNISYSLYQYTVDMKFYFMWLIFFQSKLRIRVNFNWYVMKEKFKVYFIYKVYFLCVGFVFLTPETMGGGALYTPPSLSFCLLLKIIIRHPYLKILDLANLFIANAPMKNKSRNLVLPPHSEHFKMWVWKPAIAERVKNNLKWRVADFLF